MTDREKVDALLSWFADSSNVRIGGETGSRYGTLQVLQQRFGNCWDFSDLFITLCRASGLPARQVIGWLHLGEGHVWAEVAIDGRWHPRDPTSGTGCACDDVPLAVSDQGEFSYLYASPVEITLLETR